MSRSHDSSNTPAQAPKATRRQLLAGAAALAPMLVAGGVLAQSTGDERSSGTRRTGSALVTGASRGIGEAIAQRLAGDGYAVTVNYLRSADRAADVVRRIEAAGGRAIAVQGDIGDPDAVATLFERHQSAFGQIDVVVSNAGIMRLAPFAQMSDADFDAMMATNIKGSFNVLREAARRVRDGGRILALSSSITRLRSPTYGPYAASKGAQDLFVSSLAKELGDRRISVNAVAPGVVDTPLFTDGKTPQQIAGFVARTPHGRLGQPEDIANTVSLLCREEAGWITGQVVFANGGII